MLRTCETLAKLICRCSLLKSDDPRLKDQTPSYRTCINCDHFLVEDANHMVGQCEYTQDIRNHMYNDVYESVNGGKAVFENASGQVFSWLMGKTITDLTNEEMMLSTAS